MAVIQTGAFFNNNRRAMTAAQLETLRSYQKGLGPVPLADQVQFPAGIFPLQLQLAADPNNNTVESLANPVPFPVKCWGADLACLSAAGSAATADIQRDPVGSPATFTSIFAAAVDIKTGAAVFQRAIPEDGRELWDQGDLIKLVVIGTGAGAVLGVRATLWLQRL